MATVGMCGVLNKGVAEEPFPTESGGVGRWSGGESIGGEAVASVPGGVVSSMMRFSVD